ncbi:unnamed protein product, partial [Phaeothamnion confervicola]
MHRIRGHKKLNEPPFPLPLTGKIARKLHGSSFPGEKERERLEEIYHRLALLEGAVAESDKDFEQQAAQKQQNRDPGYDLLALARLQHESQQQANGAALHDEVNMLEQRIGALEKT